MSDEKKQEEEEKRFQPSVQFTKKQVADNAVNKSVKQYCMGYGFGTMAYGYIAIPKLSVAKVSTKGLDTGTANIVSYDKTEKDDAYIGEINMLTASSFCGLNGLIWGYHLCNNIPQDLKPMFEYPGYWYKSKQKLPGQDPVPVYPIGPLLQAGVGLFGRMDKEIIHNVAVDKDRRRFPPLPGSMVVCANKNAGLYGPGYVWSILGIAIAKDRLRNSNLFIEDANAIKAVGTEDTEIQLSEESVREELRARLLNIAKSMILCGQDQNVIYEKIFMGAKYIKLKKGEYGTALCCAPYVQLPTDAIPSGLSGGDLVDMTLKDWETKLKLKPLPPLDIKDELQDMRGVGTRDGTQAALLFAIKNETNENETNENDTNENK